MTHFHFTLALANLFLKTSICTSSHKCPIIYGGQYHSINKTEILLEWGKAAVQLTVSLKSGVSFFIFSGWLLDTNISVSLQTTYKEMRNLKSKTASSALSCTVFLFFL